MAARTAAPVVHSNALSRDVQRRDGGTTGIDNDFAARSFENLGAWIMGRNMFGPRAALPTMVEGRWGANPPHYAGLRPHAPSAPLLEMKAAPSSISSPSGSRRRLTRQAAAHGKDVRIGGGAATIRQYLQAGLLGDTPRHLADPARPAILFEGIHFSAGQQQDRLHRGGDALSGGRSARA
jgi:hypothetical protein